MCDPPPQDGTALYFNVRMMGLSGGVRSEIIQEQNGTEQNPCELLLQHL